MSEFDIKSSTIDKSLDTVKGFLQKLVGPSIDEMGLLLADNVKLWRLKNQIRNIEKVKAIVDKEKVNVKQVNLKVLFPYLEGISLEEDEELQDLWAKLFVNYIDVSKNLQINVYPDVLRQLSTEEVHVLKYVAQTKYGALYTDFKKHKEQIEFKDETLANLERLGLIKEVIEINQPTIYDGQIDDIYTTVSEEYELTLFAYAFLDAVGIKVIDLTKG